jgi:hypothetical protein
MKEEIEKNSIEDLSKKILRHKEELRNMKHSLFSDNKELFYSRIVRVCEQLVRGREKPTCCNSGDYSIEFGIVETGLNGLLKEQYRSFQSRNIAFDVEDHFSDSKLLIFIKARIETIFHDKVEDSIIIMFPVNDYDFDVHIERLKDSADKREEKIKKDTKEGIRTMEDIEKEQLKFLKSKYETEK